ncbi:MAG: hypothetical protein OXF42_05795 [Candidatus Dadabacteria bacterium]|nr:hypothetical protein [Candidatus Dadabacteria bacterium]
MPNSSTPAATKHRNSGLSLIEKTLSASAMSSSILPTARSASAPLAAFKTRSAPAAGS